MSGTQARGWALEDVCLVATVADGDFTPAQMQSDVAFVAAGFVVEGGTWSRPSASLELSETLRSPLPPVLLEWHHRGSVPPLAAGKVCPHSVRCSRARCARWCRSARVS
jgi:hypothetical protein